MNRPRPEFDRLSLGMYEFLGACENYIDRMDEAIVKSDGPELLDLLAKLDLFISSYGQLNPELSVASHDLKSPLQVLSFSCELKKWDRVQKAFVFLKKTYNCIRKSILYPNETEQIPLGSILESNRFNFAVQVLGISSTLMVDHNDRYEYQEKNTNRRFVLWAPGQIDVQANWPVVARAVMNILSNASRHNPNTDLRVELLAEANEEKVRLNLFDNGKGIDDEEAVFKKGYSTGGEGHDGLGLWSSRSQLESAGSTLSLKGHGGPRGGAYFTITLPRSQSNQ